MDQQHWFAEPFEQYRGRLRGVAYRMLESRSDADDAVQETWLRLSSADETQLQNLGGWLTTVIPRVCLDILRARKLRREEPAEAAPLADSGHVASTSDPEQEAMMADAVGLASACQPRPPACPRRAERDRAQQAARRHRRSGAPRAYTSERLRALMSRS